MTTPQLPPLPEPEGVIVVRTQALRAFTADQMRAYALAALSNRPVAESIHEANARTLQAVVDELREMLGVKEGESLKEAVKALSASAEQSEPIAHLWMHEATGHTRVVMNDEVWTASNAWFCVGPIVLAAPIKKEQDLAYGCHCDLEPGMQPDGCVLDEGSPDDCVKARGITKREQCDEWRPVSLSIKKEQEA